MFLRVMLAFSLAVGGSLLLDETFEGSSVTDPGFVPLNDACLTGASAAPPAGESALGRCTAHQTGPVPPVGVTPGYLQLTDAQGGATGGVLYNRPLPGNGGLQVTFEQYQYGGTGADGISFFLVDGATELTSAGAYGGGLGYAQRGDEPGVADGYLGVGLDAYGNYAVDFEGRGTGCPAGQQAPPEYQVYDRPPNNVTLRGPGNGTTGYCYLAGTGTTTQIGTDPDGNKLYGSTLPGRLHDTALGTAKRTVRITVSADTRPTVTVEIDFGSGFQTVLTGKMPQDAPRTYKFGFAASTGSDTDVHLIRNVSVRSLEPLRALNLVKQVDKATPQPDVYQVGDTVPYEFVVTNTGTTPLTGVRVTDPHVSGIVCPRTTLATRGEPDASMRCTASHVLTAAEIQDGKFTNTAVARSNEATSGPSTVSVPVSAGLLRLTKKASTSTARPGDVVTYTIIARNPGDQPVRNARFDDDLTAVLDDGDYLEDADASVGNVGYTSPTLTWTGSLDAGQVATITYHVRVKAGGDGRLANQVSSTTSGSNCPAEAACRAVVTLPKGRLSLTKHADHRYPRTGSRLTYRIVARNTGAGPLTNASFTDDLSGDLDDARYNGDAKASTGTVTYAAPRLTWRGSLEPGQSAVITYSLRIKGGGDGKLRNAVVSTSPGSSCPPGRHGRPCVSVSHRVPRHTK